MHAFSDIFEFIFISNILQVWRNERQEWKTSFNHTIRGDGIYDLGFSQYSSISQIYMPNVCGDLLISKIAS